MKWAARSGGEFSVSAQTGCGGNWKGRLDLLQRAPHQKQTGHATEADGALAVDAFFFRDQGALEDEGVDGANVFADDAERDELDGAEKKEAQY
jgi:hypothetical protein